MCKQRYFYYQLFGFNKGDQFIVNCLYKESSKVSLYFPVESSTIYVLSEKKIKGKLRKKWRTSLIFLPKNSHRRVQNFPIAEPKITIGFLQCTTHTHSKKENINSLDKQTKQKDLTPAVRISRSPFVSCLFPAPQFSLVVYLPAAWSREVPLEVERNFGCLQDVKRFVLNIHSWTYKNS